jgi:Flp pilus assembly protein TadD
VRTACLALAFVALLLGVAQGEDKPSEAAAQHNARGAALLKEGKLEEAVVELETAAEAAPKSVVIQSNLAYAYDRHGKIDDAVAAYRKVLDLDPDSAIIRNNLATLYSKQGLYDEAIKEFTDLLQRDPANATTKANLETATKKQTAAQQRQEQIGVACKRPPPAQAIPGPRSRRPASTHARVIRTTRSSGSPRRWRSGTISSIC